MSRFPARDVVYLVTQEDLSAGRSTIEVVDGAIDGGVDVVQLREKDQPARDRYQLGRELRERTAEASVTLIVNDRVDIAQAVDADGVHLGEEDLPISVARNQLGPNAIIGRSVSTVADAQQAEDAGADYLGVGSIFNTSSKDTPPAESAIGPERVREIQTRTTCPVIGIGGITPDNAADVVAAGAAGVAVISAITKADDPRGATERLSTAVANGRASR